MLVLQPCNVASVFIERRARQLLKDEPRHGIDLRVAQVWREIFGVDFGASDGLVHLAFDGEVGCGVLVGLADGRFRALGQFRLVVVVVFQNQLTI